MYNIYQLIKTKKAIPEGMTFLFVISLRLTEANLQGFR